MPRYEPNLDYLADMQVDRGKSEPHPRERKIISGRAVSEEAEAAFRSEREATRLDASNPLALAELREWEATLEDGLG